MIKLNIQRFSSTNKTTHYELSQFVGSDKPSWLNDYNGDNSKIDAAIYSAKTTADGAATAAGNAATAAEGAQNTANTAVTNAATADGKAVQAQTDIGTKANLTTTVKTDLVSAINEVDSNADSALSKIGTITNLETDVKTDLVSAINELANDLTFDNTNVININNQTTINTSGFTVSNVDLHFVKSLNSKTVRLYGFLQVSNCTQYTNNSCTIAIDTGLRPTSDIVVYGTIAPLKFCYAPAIIFKTDGNIALSFTPNDTQFDMYFINTEIIIDDFGHIVQ